MNNAVAALFVSAQAEQAYIEAMKAENQTRHAFGMAAAYSEDYFAQRAANLERIATEMTAASNNKD